jgi:hypothetical protein
MRSLKVSKDKIDMNKLKYKFFVFDTETTKLEPMQKNFVFGVIYGFNYSKVIYSVEDFKKEFESKRYENKIIFAHNAEFDLLTIFGNIFTEVDTTAIFNGKFISAKWLKITFADSMNIYPTSVEKIGNLIGLPKLENKKVKGQKLTKENITSEDVKYCTTDCKIVFNALLRMFELIGNIKITLPSLAMYDFRKNYLTEDINFSELVDEFFDSYYGGRTEAFKIGNVNATVFDVNSLYPYAMRNCIFPDVKHLKKEVQVDTKFLLFALQYYEGMAKVTVRHNDCYFGTLPVRMKINKAEKLVFPVGEFETTVNFNELRFSLNNGFIEILKVHYIVYANPVKSPFINFIEDNYKKRMKSRDELNRTIYKLKMNSLYGRFGMRMKLNTEYFNEIPFNIIRELKESDKYCDIQLFNEQRNDCFLITENERFKNSFFSIPTYSSYITSEARVILLKALIANEDQKVVYCDTDSIFLEGKFIGNVSEGLGDFKKEDKKVIEINGLKNYVYEKDNKKILVIKGISASAKKEVNCKTGEEEYHTQKYYKTKQSLRQGKEAGESFEMIKVLRQKYDKREVLENGETKPIILKNNKVVNVITYLKTKKPYKKQNVIFNYDAHNLHEEILLFFIKGGKIHTKDFLSHITNKKELKYWFGLYSNKGLSMDTFNDNLQINYYTKNIIDDFQSILLKYSKISDMKKYFTDRYSNDKISLNYDLDFSDVPF